MPPGGRLTDQSKVVAGSLRIDGDLVSGAGFTEESVRFCPQKTGTGGAYVPVPGACAGGA